MGDTRTQRIATGVILSGAAVWLLLRAWHFAGWMDDDAFISFRYARNWARGLGLVFNAGERVEGYTNFLWTTMLAAAARLGLDLPATAQVLGTAFALASLFLLTRLTKRVLQHSHAPGWWVALPAVLLALSESWAAWAVSGLENVAAGFWILLAVDAFAGGSARDGRERDRRLAACAVFAALAAMTHPAHGLVAIALATVLGAQARMGERPWRDVARFAGVFALLYGAYFVWRVAYYGALVPNTFYAKVGASGALWLRGAGYLVQVARAFPLLFCGFVVAALDRPHRPEPAVAAALAIVGAALAYAIAIGGDAFPAQRLFVAVLPLLAMLAVYALQAGVARLATPAPAVAIVAAAALSIGIAIPAWFAPATRKLDAAIARDAVTMYRTAGEWMRDHFAPGAVLAYSGAGIIPYYGEMPFIDTLGLTDAHIARAHVAGLGSGMAGHERGDGRYVFERKPDWILFTGAPISSLAPHFKTDHELVAIQEFHMQYQPVRVPLRYTTRRDRRTVEFDLHLYRRTDGR